jgi:hypothetical protein
MGVSPTALRSSHGVAADTTDARADGGASLRGRAAAPRGRALPGRDCRRGGRQPRVGHALEAAPGAGGHAGTPRPPAGRAGVPPHRGAVAPARPLARSGCPGGRVRDRALDAAADRRRDRAHVRRPVPLPLARARPARPRLESPAAAPAGQGARRGARGRLAAAGLAADQKGARRTGRAIAFLDETGHTFRARVGTTWAPRSTAPPGCTPATSGAASMGSRSSSRCATSAGRSGGPSSSSGTA